MARQLFPPDVVFLAGTGSPPAALLAAAQAFTVWTARTGGTNVTSDIRDVDGVTGITAVADANGQRPYFTGPDNATVLFIDAGSGTRYPCYSTDMLSQLAAFGALLNTAQTWTAAQTFNAAVTVPDGSLSIAKVNLLASTLATKADLVSGKIPTNQLPSGVLTPVFRGTVSSQANMVALSAAVTGDWCIRTDVNAPYGARFDLTGAVYSSAGNWTQNPGGSAVTLTNVPAGYRYTLPKVAGVWPDRGSARTDITPVWKGPLPTPTIVTPPATNGAYAGDELEVTP